MMKNSRLFFWISRFFHLLRKYGFKIVLHGVVMKLASDCLAFLNRRTVPKLKEGYVIKNILGSKMYLDTFDEGICRDLIIDGIREASQVETVVRELKEGDIVVDIGANIGYYALLEAKLIGDKGKVYAIEPVPENIDLLKKNIALNKLSNIEVHQLAIGDKNGSAPMYTSVRRNLGTLREVSQSRKDTLVKGTVNVEVVTLDHFINNKPNPRIIRMDVEGYEYQVIKGMSGLLRMRLPLTIFIEFHFPTLKKEESVEILGTLHDSGFEIVDVTSELAIRGRSQHKFLWNTVYRMYSLTREKLNNKPWGNHLNMSINDVLKSGIVDAEWGTLHMCFKRN